MAVQLMDAAAFFDHLRARPMMGPVLSADEVDGCNRLLSAAGGAGWGVAWTAYALATAWHETAHSMQPVIERGGAAYHRGCREAGARRRTGSASSRSRACPWRAPGRRNRCD